MTDLIRGKSSSSPSGTRHFTGGLPISGSVISQGPVTNRDGRIVFAIAAVALDLMVVAVAVRWMRRKADESGG